jgi:hypothetical protein
MASAGSAPDEPERGKVPEMSIMTMSARQVHAALARVAARLEKNTAERDRLYAERLALYQRGVELKITHDALAASADCSSVAVSKALSKANRQE